MSNRLNQEREQKLTPVRMEKALLELNKRDLEILSSGAESIRFNFKNNVIVYFVYSGWATGKGLKDGRGLKNLLKQLDEGAK